MKKVFFIILCASILLQTNAQSTFNIDLDVNGVTYTMVQVSGGNATLGLTKKNSTVYPSHVEHLQGFYIGETEVTQELWTAVMENNPSSMKCNNCPVNMVRYVDAIEFCERLSKMTGFTFTLPTESQWEYAARGAYLSQKYNYAGSNNPNLVAWSKENSEGKIHPVKTKKANELGLYDMNGNVGEWCQKESEYSAPMRGGSYADAIQGNADDESLAIRSTGHPVNLYDIHKVGFRIVITDTDRVLLWRTLSKNKIVARQTDKPKQNNQSSQSSKASVDDQFVPKAEFKKIWIEHDVIRNGQMGLSVHVSFSISGFKGQRCQANAYFESPKGRGISDLNNSYNTTNGKVCASTEFTPKYDNSTYSDVAIFIPISELHATQSPQTIFAYVRIQIPSGKLLEGKSEYESFVFSGPTNNYKNNDKSSIAFMDIHAKYSHSKYINGIGHVISSEKTSNGTYIYKYSSGWVERIVNPDKCNNCGGDGYIKISCAICGGTGKMLSYMGYPPRPSYMPCTYCGAQGGTKMTCVLCRGKGETYGIIAKNEKKKLYYISLLGEKSTVETEAEINAKAQMNSRSLDLNGSTPSNNNRTSSSPSSGYLDCPLCGGSGKCSTCAGRGQKYHSDGTPYECFGCNGGGRCTGCHGKGKIYVGR